MLRKALVSVALLVIVAAGAAGYLWRQGTALPEWYEEELESIEQLEAESEGPSLSPDAPLEWSVIPDAEPTKDDGPTPKATKKKAKRVMRGFHLRSGASSKAARKAFRASRATLEDGKLEAGVVVNVSKAPRDQLTRKEKQFFERVTKAFPPLARRDVYVALEDEPVAGEDGILQLGPDPHVRVGDLSYSLSKLAKKLGTNPTALRRDINNELRRMKVKDPADIPPLSPGP